MDLERFLITPVTYFWYCSLPGWSSFSTDSTTVMSAQSLLSRVTNSGKDFLLVSPHRRGFSFTDGSFSELLDLIRDSESSSDCLDPGLRGIGPQTGVSFLKALDLTASTVYKRNK